MRRNCSQEQEGFQRRMGQFDGPRQPHRPHERRHDASGLKAEHVVDLDTNLILAAEVYHANQSDQQTLEDSLHQAQINQEAAGSSAQIQNVAADKGYHSAETLATLAEHTPYRTYIPEPAHPRNRRWTDKPPEQRTAVYANRRHTRGDRGKRLQRLRSEFVERTFAHVCETGGARRSWLHG